MLVKLSILERLKLIPGKFNDIMPKFEELAKQYHRSKYWFLLDLIFCRFVYGTKPRDYFCFAMYKMRHLERKQYVSWPFTCRMEKLLNPAPDKEQVIDDKARFNRMFAQYIHREWIDARERSLEEIEQFVVKHGNVMVKPPLACKGAGVYKASCKDIPDLSAFAKKMKDENLLLEEFIVQHPAMAEINPSSVNTIRVALVRDRAGEVHVIGTSLRVGGKDSDVDNFSVNGVQYPVDPQTGLIIGGGVNVEGKRNIYFHPSTNKQMIGLQIPLWDEVLRTAKEAAAIPEDIRYLGWDIAVTENGCEIIEANTYQGFNGMQQDGVGKKNMILQYK